MAVPPMAKALRERGACFVEIAMVENGEDDRAYLQCKYPNQVGEPNFSDIRSTNSRHQ
jgi:hypothetical protein